MFFQYISLAWKFALRHRRKTLATGGFILLGTSVLVLMHGITVGVNDTMVLNTTHLHYGHLFAETDNPEFNFAEVSEEIIARTGAEGVLQRSRFTGILAGDNGKSLPVIFYGVEPGKEANHTAIAKRIVNGKYFDPDSGGVVIGKETAQKLGVNPDDFLSIYNQEGSFLGRPKVDGVFSTDIVHFDSGVVYIPLAYFPDSDLLDNVHELSIFFPFGVDIDSYAGEIKKISSKLPPFRSWKRIMPDLVQLIDLNELSIKIIMFFVFFLVGAGICNNYILTIVERYHDFGILRAMGLTPIELVTLVFWESFMICTLATFVGLLTGALLVYLTSINGIDLGSLTSHNRYFVISGVVKPRLIASGLILPGSMAIFVSLISSLIPARIAASKTPVDRMRY
jgi:ABC-type lipoprotein release transport system permease subunit